MAGRRGSGVKAVAPDISWVAGDMEALGNLAKLDMSITIASYGMAHKELTRDQSEERLRKLTQMGWLRMTAVREHGEFLMYVWFVK